MVAEADLVAWAREGDEVAVRELIRRYNPRLFRVARGVLSNDSAAEEVLQESYIAAFTQLHTFRGASRFSTWVTRIVLNQAKMHWRRQRPTQEYDTVTETDLTGSASVVNFPGVEDGETYTARRELQRLLEDALSQLPPEFRLPFLMYEVEQMGVLAIARDLDINPATVKTRLFRARRKLREILAIKLQDGIRDVFPFDGARCAGMAQRVIDSLHERGWPSLR